MRITHFIAILLASVLFGCGYDKFDALDYAEKQQGVVNADIGDLRAAFYTANPDRTRKSIYDDIIIGGYITSNDRSNNFYRTFTLEDHTGAIEVKAGGHALHNLYPEGRFVVVKAKGLSCGLYNEVLQIGLEPVETGNRKLPPDYFGFSGVALEGYVERSDEFWDETPTTVEITQIKQSLYGGLVRIEGLTLAIAEEAGATWATPFSVAEGGAKVEPEIGYRIFSDAAGSEIAVVTSDYALFAADVVPLSKLSLTGILSRGKTNKGRTIDMIRMRRLSDVQLE